MQASCTPGQHGIPADARLCVFLHPLENLVTGFGNQIGTITITSNMNANWVGTMDVMYVSGQTMWRPWQIAARFPTVGSGVVDETERFTITIQAGTNTYVADDVEVMGPEENGWPPVHDPTGKILVQQFPTLAFENILEPVSGGGGQR